MIPQALKRLFYTSSSLSASEKSLLAALRKKTGYTFANCKTALEKNNNDLVKAEQWLHEHAQALGWSKATKLEGRKTAQGLIAVSVRNRDAALVEINCETDFVARNATFQEMVVNAAKTCLQFAQTQPLGRNLVTKIGFDSQQLQQLQAADGKKLSDHLALIIGTVGENASLRRAFCFKASDGVHLSGYAHPSGTERNGVMLGKIAGLVAFRSIDEKDTNFDFIGKNLCQHIVGMNPVKIGSLFDKPAGNVDDETCLIYQEYLLDNNLMVGEFLKENGIEVVDFRRFECGEQQSDSVSEHTERVLQTCQ